MINPEDTIIKKHTIPIEHLDFKYVEKCNDIKELEKIYKVLASGVEGKYIELENFVCEKIRNLSPNSRVLRKDLPITSKGAFSKNEQNDIEDDINSFLNQIPSLQQDYKLSPVENSFDYLDGEIPPVRTTAFLKSNNKENKGQPLKTEIKKTTKKSPKPRDYKEWEKIEKDLEKELDDTESTETKQEPKKMNQTNSNSLKKDLIKDLSQESKTENLSDEFKRIKAESEKNKGNEAFNAGCFDEALVYYTKSIKIIPEVSSYNKRAMTHIKLEKWDNAIEDCEIVLKYEKENVKARLRKATALIKKKKYNEAGDDLELCLKVEPSNKKALELKRELNEKINEEKVKPKSANRLLIEETDGSSEDEVEKPKEIPIEINNKTIKTPIKIVEIDDEDNQSDTDSDNINDQDIEIIEPEKIEESFSLSEDVTKLKDNAFQLFSSGQYGNACEVYEKAIFHLKEIISTTSKAKLIEYYKSSLIVLYNNKAACSQKIGDYKNCIKDCNEGLDLINSLTSNELTEEYKNQKLKLVYKKASSFELLEKYSDAFFEFEALMKIDSSFKNVQQSYNRICKILNENGDLKKVKEKKKQLNAKLESERIKEKDEPKSQPKEADKKDNKLYEEFKSKGNECVKQDDFENALKFYNKCIEIDKSNPIAYLNRSLCYLKLNRPDSAINDCSFVLQTEKLNVKALYRRSSANRMKKMYDLVADDLKLLLSIEPNNQIAIKDLNEILTQKENEEEKMTQKQINSDIKIQIKKQDKVDIAEPKILVRKAKDLVKISNAYEFMQSWNSINNNDKEGYARILSNIEASNLPKFIGSKLDDEMLSRMIESIYSISLKLENKDKAFNYLKELSNTQRFKVTKLFIDISQKNMLKEIIKKFEATNAEIIKKLYDF